MAVVAIIAPGGQVHAIVSWTAAFAVAGEKPLVLVVVDPKASNDEPRDITVDTPGHLQKVAGLIRTALPDELPWKGDAGSDDAETPDETAPDEGAKPVTVVSVSQRRTADAVLGSFRGWGASLLVIDRDRSTASHERAFALQRRLYRDAPCTTLQLCLDHDDPPSREAGGVSVLVAAGGASPSGIALKLAAGLAKASGGRLTALYVQPAVDEVALQVGRRTLRGIVNRYLAPEIEGVRMRVELNDDATAGIASACAAAETPYDLVLLGANHHGPVHRFLFHDIAERVIADSRLPSVGIVRRAAPLHSRLRRWAERLAVDGVPQLDRDQRIALVERVGGSSRWDFDFVALTCLSTLIAGLGLLQGSVAVVIGAMLIAPLMTPLIGAGLSLVQGNIVLLRHAVTSVLRGFLVAFVLAVTMGMLVHLYDPGFKPTTEMLGRGAPRVLDLLVALVSGVAAAYAIGRPRLVSALPGVAIAAALVPPIATAGLSTALGDFELARGAALLFLTNIVAIVVGTAAALWAVGIRGSHSHGALQRWTRWITTLLLVILVAIGVVESMPRGVPDSLREAIESRLAREEDTSLRAIRLGRGAPPFVEIEIAAARPATASLARAIGDLVETHGLAGHEVRLTTMLELRAEP